MFVGKSVAEFEVNGLKAQFIIDNAMPVEAVQAIVNQIMHFCVERQKEAQNEAAQKLKDEEAAKKAELEQEEVKEAPEESEAPAEEVKEELAPAEEGE